MKDINFTIEQRNTIYVKALELYSDRSIQWALGLCWAVSKAAQYVCSTPAHIAYDLSECNGINGMKVHFPEVYKHRPKEAQTDWFSHSTKGINKRIAILNQAIKETNP